MDLFGWVTMLAKLLFVVVVLLQVVPIMVWVERRGSALMQDRLGPNRVGPLGLFQSLADVVKFVWKEDIVPGHVMKFYYILAPLVCVIPAFMTFAVIPFAGPIVIGDRVVNFQVAELNVGFLYIFAVASLGVYGIIMAGWASNNKYALLGSLRSSAQMISYELSMGLSVVGIVMTFSSLQLGDIVAGQTQWFNFLGVLSLPKWGIFIQPVAFIIFLAAAHAETNRLPFDLPEGESEIIAGYHLEYGSMKFAMFFMAEYLNMLTAAGLMATLFLGGWHLPGSEHILNFAHLEGMTREWVRVGLQLAAFATKVLFFMWVFVWTRWTLPRFRYDQVMDLGWKVMLPLSLVNILVTGLFIYQGWI